MKNTNKQGGFTLVELMIVVAIIGILAGIGTTLLLNYLPNMRLKSAARDIFSTMMQAKVEAIRRGENVSLSFNTGGNTYTMFLDNGAGGGIAGNGLLDGTETILQAVTPLPTGVTFNGATTFGNNALVFTSRGIPINGFNNGLLGNGTVNLRTVDSLGNTLRQRSIAVSTAGRISMN